MVRTHWAGPSCAPATFPARTRALLPTLPARTRALFSNLPALACAASLLMAGAAHGASTTVVVNEVQTGSLESAADEFVEIANVADTPFDLTGCRLVYRSATSTSDQTLARFTQGPILPAGGVLVFGGSQFTGPRDATFSVGLSASGGGVAIRDSKGNLIDAMAYGPADNGFAEGQPTILPPRGHSVERVPCGFDSDDNARNFQEIIIPTPRVTCSGVRAPSVETAAFSPAAANPGASITLSVTILAGTYAVASVSADLGPLGGSAAASLVHAGGRTWTRAVAISADTPPGPAVVRVVVKDEKGGQGFGYASLYVNNPVPARVVINEVQTAGATTDTEFVELYNRTDTDVDLTGWRLVYRGPTSDEDTVLCVLTSGTVKAHAFYLFGTEDLNGGQDATMKAGLSGTGGGLALKDKGGVLVDSVGYGTAVNAYVEAEAAPAPEAGASIERVPAGADTNNNHADFTEQETATPTPAVNKPIITAVTFQPESVTPGHAARLTVHVTPGDAAVTQVAADLIVLGGDFGQPLAPAGGDAWTLSITVAPLTTVGAKSILVHAKDAAGIVATGFGTLLVTDDRPIPPVKVNEVQTGGLLDAADEFVEVYNAGDTAVDLTGWTLVYRSASGQADTALFAFTGKTIAPHGFLLLAGSEYVGSQDGEMAATLAATGGGVGLRDPLGRLADSVGYGKATNALVETGPAPAPGPGESIGRRSDGLDTGDNAADWRVQAVPTPHTGASFSVRGDLDGDGALSAADALLALKSACGLSSAATGLRLEAGDVWPPPSGDGCLAIADAVRLLRAVYGRDIL